MTLSNADDTGATSAVAEQVAMARSRIAATAPDPSRVRLVAVTKGFGPDAVRAALAAGVTDIGENYADELVGKAEALATSGVSGAEPAPRWHFLGAVQRNKVARLAPLVDCWQSVARIEEGRAIARRHPGSTVLVQVDVAGGHGRNGCPPEGVAELVTALAAEELDVAGLMTIGPPGPAEASRPAFALVRELASGLGLAECSMGMTDDMDVALAEGSTMIRLGRALFGERPPRPRP
jgi:pyridoxal phosphate enzyme (YggS family)